jgi:hypothetical protein
MRRFFFLSIVILGVLSSGYYFLMRDSIWVKHYRSTHQITQSIKGQVDLTGLEELRVSGSNLIIFPDLQAKLKDVSGPIYILDLTNGSHRYYKDYPLTFLGINKNNPSLTYRLRRLLAIQSFEIPEEQTASEEEMAKKYGFNHHFLKLERRGVPTPEMIDQLLSFLKNVPKDAWIHVHCLAGKGRTTSIMVMIDILRNASRVKLEDIVKRHYLLGGVDLFDTTVWDNGTYTQEQLTKRKEFIIHFHRYVTDPQGYGSISWQQWCHNNNINPSAALY